MASASFVPISDSSADGVPAVAGVAPPVADLKVPKNWTRSARTSIVLRFCPSVVSQVRDCRTPSTKIGLPLCKCWLQASACLSHTVTVKKHTSSLISPDLSLKRRLTANPKLVTATPEGEYLNSGSRV